MQKTDIGQTLSATEHMNLAELTYNLRQRCTVVAK